MDNVMQSVKGFSSPRYVILAIVGVALLLVFSFLSFRLTEPVMSTLYSNLNTDDSSSVVTELGAMGVKFDVKNGGAEILTESQDVLKVRMMLAEKGLPSKASIVGYEIFDKDNLLGTSNFVMNVNLVRALEGELSRSIAALSSIKSARVHIVMPRKDIFKRQDIEPSASVVINLNNRLDVPKEEALAVRHIISSSVPGLKPSKVTIIDNNGTILAKAQIDDDQMFGAGGDSTEYQFQLEQRYRKVINSLIEQAVGAGKVETQVSVEVSFEKVTVSSESYDPDSQVARSVQNSEMVSTSTDGSSGEVSVASELTGGGAGGDSSSQTKTDEIANFEISKTITNKVNDTGVVQKISIAVLVDGKYTKDAEGEEIYVPRSDEELDQISTLVKSAIGFTEARGDEISVVNMQFSRESNYLLPEEGAFDWLKRDLDSIIKTLVIGIVAILAIMLIVRPLVSKAFDISSKDLEAEELKILAENEALAQQAGAAADEEDEVDINLDLIQNKVDSSPAQRVSDIIDSNPDETLNVIRTWLTQNR